MSIMTDNLTGKQRILLEAEHCRTVVPEDASLEQPKRPPALQLEVFC